MIGGVGHAKGDRRIGMKLLVPVDGSDGSLAALDIALTLAVLPGASVTVLQVIEDEGPLPTHDEQPPPGIDRVSYLAQLRFAKVAPLLARTQINWSRVIEEGSVPDAICKVAEREHSDMIVIGSRGLSAMGRLLLGSVSELVAKHAPCNVLIARPPAHRHPA
jgi:nucleotide-binding universal stress UspA family protein